MKRLFRGPRTLRLIPAMMSLVVLGCNETFEPKAPYQSGLVIYSILSNRSDSLLVRIYSTYDPSGHNPLDNTSDTDLRGARVTVATDSSAFVLAGTVIPRADKSRYTSDINAYVAQPFFVQDGKAYTLTVTSPVGNASAKVTTPGPGMVEANNGFILKSPDKYAEDISTRVRLSPVTYGYILRLYLEYDAKVGTRTVHIRSEVPTAIRSSAEVGNEYSYPMLVRRVTDRYLVYEIVYFSLEAYKAFLLDQMTQYGEIKITSATFVLTQVESNLYKYYSIANGFLDEFSIRTDLPDYSNVTGGFGVFGAMRDDSVVVDLH